MQLKTHGDELAVMRGRAMLSADYTPGDRGPGKLALEIVDQETFESKQAVVHLDPWRGNVYEVIEWPECEALLLCGAPQIVALALPTLRFGAAVALEYEEVDTLDRPWVVEIPNRRLVVATERRIWCLDERIAIRWMWSSRTGREDRWLFEAPRMEGSDLRVPVRMLHRDGIVALSADDGIER